MPPVRHLLIAGGSGVIGSAAVDHFARLPGWQVTALCRRPPVVAQGLPFAHLPLDLRDAPACAAAIAALPPVTHLIFAAVAEVPGLAAGWRDAATIADNGALFTNLLAPLAQLGSLRHVSLLQGTKAYGAHVHPVPVPLREDAPRSDHPNFYWLHEDALRAAAAASGFAFTIWRPQVLLGWAPGAAMNPVPAIGAYAALCQERGAPFPFPTGTEALCEMVDASLLAEAMAWATDAPAAADQIFNITNGDVFMLRHAWPRLAQSMGLGAPDEPPASFTALLDTPEARTAWQGIARKHDLREASLPALLGQSAHYLDLLLATRIATKPNPVLLSTIKLRQAGFAPCRDSLAALTHHLRQMIALRLLPPLFDPA